MSDTQIENCLDCGNPILIEIGQKYLESKIISGDRNLAAGSFVPMAKQSRVTCSCGAVYEVRGGYGEFVLIKQ